MADRKFSAYEKKRRAKRDRLWDDAETVVYDKRAEAGFCTVPRTLPLIAALIRHLSAEAPARVYTDLWFRQRDDGFVDAVDPEEMAQCAGYPNPPRNLSTWREAIERLVGLGFIRTESKGTRKHRWVLILHPHDVVERLREDQPDSIPPWWWDMFTSQVEDIGATLRGTPKEQAAAREAEEKKK